MSRWKKIRRPVWITLGVLAVVLVGWGLAPRGVPADFGRVERGAMEQRLEHEGRTRVRDLYVVSAPVDGRLLRVELEPGDPVVAGETVLATFLPAAPTPLDARTRAEALATVKAAEAELGRARAERERMRAERDLAQSLWERANVLGSEGVFSKEETERREKSALAAREGLAAAEAAVESADQQLAVARARLLDAGDGAASGGTIALRAPVDGVVLRRLRESDSPVPRGTPLLEVADVEKLEVVADYLSQDAVRIREAMPVQLERWGGGAPLLGKVRRVEPAGFMKISALGVEEQRVNVVVDFDEPREAFRALGDAYRVEVAVIVWQAEDVLTLPASALFRDGLDWAVYAVESGRVRKVKVEIGHQNGTQAELLAGLGEGADVVVHPSDAVVDGGRVRPRD